MIKHFTTSVFILNEIKTNFDVLLIHHNKFNKWMIPGGHIEEDENPIEAAKREVLEETGVQIDLISFLHSSIVSNDSTYLLPPEYFFEQLIPVIKDKASHFHLDLNYISLYRSGDLKINERETSQLKWINIEEINQLDMFESTRNILLEIQGKIKNNLSYKKFN